MTTIFPYWPYAGITNLFLSILDGYRLHTSDVWECDQRRVERGIPSIFD